jgi:hypothetical protein
MTRTPHGSPRRARCATWLKGDTGRVSVTVVATILTAPGSYVVQRALSAWGVLDPLSDAVGKWLKLHVSPEAAGWTLAVAFILSIYGLILWLVWHHRKRSSEERQGNDHFVPAQPPPGSTGGVFLGGRNSKWIGGTIEDNIGHGVLDMGEGNEIRGAVVRGNRPSRYGEAAPEIPININSLGAYVRGFPRVRSITREIAERLDRQVSDKQELGGAASAEQAAALGLRRLPISTARWRRIANWWFAWARI